MSVSSPALTTLAQVLRQHRNQRATRRRKLSAGRQALLVMAYLRKGETYNDLACGFNLGTSTVYRYVREALALLAAMAPTLDQAIEVARRKAFVILDGTLLRIDRVGMAGGRDRPYYSGKHKAHGVNVQVIADPAGRLWLADKAAVLSTSTVLSIRSILRRAVSRTQARDKVKRNVVLLCDAPKGQDGRPSKALTLADAEELLAAAEADASSFGTYIVVSLLLGARTEELRALTWSHVELRGSESPPIPPHIMVWRSVRVGGDTKTRRSRRTLALPARAVTALASHRIRQGAVRALAGTRWCDRDLVFASEVGTELDAANVRRGFRRIARSAGLVAGEWTPRELRHSFVSLLSDARVPIEQIARLVGHSGTSVTEQIYRHQLRPVLEDGATAMDLIFPAAGA